MSAAKGNKYWEFRSKDGKPKKYTPSELWNKACEYFEWCTDNPLKEAVVHGKDSNIIGLNKMRAFTETGLCIYLDISTETFRNYLGGEESYKDYFGVSTRIREIIYTQKFEGAAADLLNANIIARDLGLKDITQQEVSLNPITRLEIIRTDAGKPGT